jgi:hypothetical protein
MIREVGFDDPAVRALLAESSDELGHWPKGGGTVEAGEFDAFFVYGAIGCAGRGYDALRLDTGGDDALALFRAAGFEPIADYNGNPHARHWFGKQLTRRGAHGSPA